MLVRVTVAMHACSPRHGMDIRELNGFARSCRGHHGDQEEPEGTIRLLVGYAIACISFFARWVSCKSNGGRPQLVIPWRTQWVA